MPMSSDSNGSNKLPQVGHSQSDLFINKQSISDKMVADCVESLIGTYVYVSMNYYTHIILVIFLILILFLYSIVELKLVSRFFMVLVLYQKNILMHINLNQVQQAMN